MLADIRFDANVDLDYVVRIVFVIALPVIVM